MEMFISLGTDLGKGGFLCNSLQKGLKSVKK